MERWMWVKGYKGLYQISNYGKVRSYLNNKWGIGIKGKYLSLNKKKNGYVYVDLWLNKKPKRFLLSRLVAMHFILNPENKSEVNHKDGIKDNDHYINLEWVTHKENMIHAVRILNKISKLNIKDIKKIRKLFKTGKYTKVYLGKLYNVDDTNIGCIILNKTWINI